MSNANEASTKSKLRTGIFTVFALAFMGMLTVYVNNKPFWWRACEPVEITVNDATGLKLKSPVKSLGLEVGYIKDIGLVSTGVRIRICVTAPVEVLPTTQAYVRAEGFLGDKFLEMKPMKYTGTHNMETREEKSAEKKLEQGKDQDQNNDQPTTSSSIHSSLIPVFSPSSLFFSFLGISEARAEDVSSSSTTQSAGLDENGDKRAKTVKVGGDQADMQQLMSEMKSLTTQIKDSIDPVEIKSTIKQLNKTLADASRALSPQGGLTATAQRSLIKLEDTIEQLRDQVTRINQGQGSLGMIINDPVYAEEMKKALFSINHLLNKANEMRLNVSLSLQELSAYSGARAAFDVVIWPRPDRFYRIGIATDPRGKISQVSNTSYYNGTTNGPIVTTTVNQGGYMFTAMVGKHVNRRVDISVGLLYGDGAAALNVNLGPQDDYERLQAKGELYFRSGSSNGSWTSLPDGRIYMLYQPVSIFFVSAGLEGIREQNGTLSTFYGGGLRFDDEDIRIIFSFL